MRKKIQSLYVNKYVKISLCVAAGVALLGWAWCSCGPNVAVIDFSVVQAKAKVYQSVLTEQRKYEDQIRIRVIADSGDLEKEVQALEKQKGLLKPEEYQKKAIALQRKLATVQEKYRPVVERVVAASQLALKGAEKQIGEAIQKTAKQKNVKIILPKNSTIYVKDSVDLTDAFVKNLDKLVQSVPYPDPTKLGG